MENYIYWRNEGEEYDEAKSLLYSYQNAGESYDIQIDRDYYNVKFIKIVPNDSIKRMGRITVRTVSEKKEEFMELLVVLLSCMALGLIISLSAFNNIIHFFGKKPFTSFFITLLLLVLIVFSKYLFMGYYFIFRDVSIDSFIHTLPNYIDQIKRLSEFNLGNGWNQYIGLGMEQKAFFPTLQNWFLLFGEDALFYLIGFNAALKVLISGICAYFYAGMFTNNNAIKWVAGLGYAFSGMMIIRSPWETYGTIVALSMFWLLMFEYTLKKNTNLYVIVGTIVFFVTMKSYDALLFTLIFGGYIFFRITRDKTSIKNLIKLEMIFLVFSIGSSMDVFIYQLPQILDSRRFSSSSSDFGLFVSWKELVSGFCRTVSMDIQGVTKNYSEVGAWNFLEDPTFYCGLIIIISIPSCLAEMSKKSRWKALAPYVLILIYVLIVPVRFWMNGKGGLTWKLSSLWIPFVLIYYFVNHGEILFKKQKKPLILLNITSIGVMAALIMLYINSLYTNYESLILSICFVSSYTFLLDANYIGLLKTRSISDYIIIFVTCEALLFSFGVLNNRCVLTKEDLNNGTGYFDDSLKAVNCIAEKEKKQPYRIDKQFLSASNCDSLVQRYMDVEAYVGGEGIGRSIYDIVDYYGLPNGLEYRILDGSSTNNYFNTMIATKYIISRNPDIANYGYSRIDQIGDIFIFENENYLPFVYAYNKNYTISSFEKLTSFERSKSAIGGCFVLDERAIDYNGINNNVGITEIECNRVEDTFYPHEYKGVGLRFDVTFNNLGDDREGVLYYVGKSGIPNYYHIQIPKGKSQSSFEIAQNSISSFWLDPSSSQLISNTSVYALNNDYYSEYRDAVRDLNEHSLRVSFYDENSIIGSIVCDKERYLFAAIPYNRYWHITIDGVEQEVKRVNGGFLGARIEKGEHQVRIWFETRPWIICNIFKLLSILLLLVLFARRWCLRYKTTKNIIQKC